MKLQRIRPYKGPIPGRILCFAESDLLTPGESCCEDLWIHNSQKERIIFQLARMREFHFRVSDNLLQKLNFCPWCGLKFPHSLRDEYAAIVFDHLGYDPLDLDLEEKLPAEFKSDAWWKNRGL